MTSPSATRRLPFWISLVASLALAGYGVWSATNRLSTLEAGLVENTATAADVYAGQSWILFDSGLAVAGIIAVFITLAVWALGGRQRTESVAVATAVLPVEAAEPVVDATTAVPAVTLADEAAPVAEEATDVEPISTTR